MVFTCVFLPNALEQEVGARTSEPMTEGELLKEHFKEQRKFHSGGKGPENGSGFF